MTITALPPAPQRTDSNFADVADTWVAALPTWTTQANELAIEANGYATTATTQAGIATTQAGLATSNGAAQVALATTQAINAANSAANAAATAGVTKWVSGTLYNEGVCVWSPIDFKTYRRKITGSGTTDPSLDDTNWESLAATISNVYLLSSINANNVASIDFTNLTDYYYKYIVEYYNLLTSSSLGDTLFCQYQISDTWIADNYIGFYEVVGGSGSTIAAENNPRISFNGGIYPSLAASGIFEIYGIYNSCSKISRSSQIDPLGLFHRKLYYYNGTSPSRYSPVTGLRFILESGNITSGIFNLYGAKA